MIFCVSFRRKMRLKTLFFASSHFVVRCFSGGCEMWKRVAFFFYFWRNSYPYFFYINLCGQFISPAKNGANSPACRCCPIPPSILRFPLILVCLFDWWFDWTLENWRLYQVQTPKSKKSRILHPNHAFYTQITRFTLDWVDRSTPKSQNHRLTPEKTEKGR